MNLELQQMLGILLLLPVAFAWVAAVLTEGFEIHSIMIALFVSAPCVTLSVYMITWKDSSDNAPHPSAEAQK